MADHESAFDEAGYRAYLLSTGHSLETARSYSGVFRLFTTWCAARELRPAEARRDVMESYLADCLLRIARNTVAFRLSALRSFFNYCGREEVTAGLRVKPERLAPPRPLSEGGIARLLAACRNDRDRAMIILALKCGLRVAELAGLRAADVDQEHGRLLVRGKGSKQRWVGLSDETLNLLKPFAIDGALWRLRDGRAMTTKRAQRNLEEIARRAGMRTHWHRFRVTFASRFLEATHDLDSLRVLMGHSSADTTAHYAGYGAEERALEQMRRLG